MDRDCAATCRDYFTEKAADQDSEADYSDDDYEDSEDYDDK